MRSVLTGQLCVHCRRSPAGFWVSRGGDSVVRRPWCLACCGELDRADYVITPFGAAGRAGAARVPGYSPEPKLRRRVSPLGEPPSAAEIRSQDHSAARASRTATRMAFWATRRASTALVISSSMVVVMA
jgi:hypothetical protein